MPKKDLKEKIIEILTQPFADEWHLTKKGVNNFADQILELFEEECQKWVEVIEKVIFEWGDCSCCFLAEELKKKLKDIKK